MKGNWVSWDAPLDEGDSFLLLFLRSRWTWFLFYRLPFTGKKRYAKKQLFSTLIYLTQVWIWTFWLLNATKLVEMKVKYSRSRHNAKPTSFTSPTGVRRQCAEQEHAQYCTNHDVTSGWSCRRPENVSILSSLIAIFQHDNVRNLRASTVYTVYHHMR